MPTQLASTVVKDQRGLAWGVKRQIREEGTEHGEGESRPKGNGKLYFT